MKLPVVQDIYLEQPSSEECRFCTWVTDSLRDRLNCITRRQAVLSNVEDSIFWNLVQITYCFNFGKH